MNRNQELETSRSNDRLMSEVSVFLLYLFFSGVELNIFLLTLFVFMFTCFKLSDDFLSLVYIYFIMYDNVRPIYT